VDPLHRYCPFSPSQRSKLTIGFPPRQRRQIFNLVALVLLIGCTVANQWSNITSLTFDTSSVGAMSQTVGCLTSVVALVLFPVLWLTEAELMAWASTVRRR
jgi:hypothetical protein